MSFLAERAERLTVWVYLLIFAGVFWPPDAYLVNLNGAGQGASDIYDSTAFAFLAVFLIVALAARWQRTLRLLRCGWPVLALIGLAALSAFWAEDPGLVIRRTGTVALTSLFGVYLVSRYELGDLVGLMIKVYAAAILGSLVMIVAFPALAASHDETYVGAWRGVFSGKNALGLACAIAAMMSIYGFHRRLAPRWLCLATLVASVVALKLSDSATPLIMLLTAAYAGLFAVMLRRRTGFGLAAGFAMAVLALVAIGAFSVDSAGVLEVIGRDPTFTNRVKIWHYVLDYIARRPWLGYGFGGFWRSGGVEASEIWAMIGFKAQHAHNAWLEVALGLGAAGLGMMALNWLVGLYRIARLMTAPAARHVAFCLALLVGIFLENLTEYEFFRPGDMLWLLFVVVAVYLGNAMLAARETRRAGRSARRAEVRRAMPAAARF